MGVGRLTQRVGDGLETRTLIFRLHISAVLVRPTSSVRKHPCSPFWQRMDYCDCSWKNHAHFCGRYVASGRRNLVLQRGLHHHKAGDSTGSFLLTLPAGTTVPDHLLQRLLLFLSPPPLSVLLFRGERKLLVFAQTL